MNPALPQLISEEAQLWNDFLRVEAEHQPPIAVARQAWCEALLRLQKARQIAAWRQEFAASLPQPPPQPQPQSTP